jgi:hypothetical protein
VVTKRAGWNTKGVKQIEIAPDVDTRQTRADQGSDKSRWLDDPRSRVIAAAIGAVALVVVSLTSFYAGVRTGSPPTVSAPSATPVSRDSKSSISIRSPQGNPVPTVSCVVTIQGTGSLPSGDVLVIGNHLVGAIYYYYQPNVIWNGHSWTSKIYLNGPNAPGHQFKIIAAVMPSYLKEYLLAEYRMAKPKATWWSAPGSLPTPAYRRLYHCSPLQ